MSVPDPFRFLNGGFLHSLDLGVARAATGTPNKSISSHAAEPLVRRGMTRDDAVAVFHWGLIGTTVLGVAGIAVASGAVGGVASRGRR